MYLSCDIAGESGAFVAWQCEKWAMTCDFQQCGMCDQQSLRSACAYAQSDQSLCVTIQNGWNNRISYGCVYAQIRSGLGMHLVTYSNHDTVLFLLIVPIKGRFVWDGIHCIYIYQRLHVFLILLEYLGNLVRFSIYKGWNFPFLLGDILNIPLKGSI